MNLSHRIKRLEASIREQNGSIPYEETILQDIEDWIIHDPRAAELLKIEYKYCMSKGYPTDDSLSEVDDPVFWRLNQDALAAFNEYLNGRADGDAQESCC